MKNVNVVLHKCSSSVPYENVINTYQKGDLFCILFKQGDLKKVHKYPIGDVFRIEEDY